MFCAFRDFCLPLCVYYTCEYEPEMSYEGNVSNEIGIAGGFITIFMLGRKSGSSPKVLSALNS